jgi:hypothetical protein
MAVRLEHRLVHTTPGSYLDWVALDLIVCETVQPRAGTNDAYSVLIVSCRPRSLQWQLAATTTRLHQKWWSRCGGALRRFDSSGGGLASITSIGDDFLAYCTSMIDFNATGLTRVTTIGDRFLYCCSALPSFEAQGLGSVVAVGSGLLSDSKALTAVNTRGFDSLTWIGRRWLSCCGSLAAIDVSGLLRLKADEEVDEHFMFGCSALELVTCEGGRPGADTAIGRWLRAASRNYLFE